MAVRNLESLTIGISPLTERVYVGWTQKGHPNIWSQKDDCTARFCGALMTWAPPGTHRIIEGGGRKYKLEIVEIPNGS